MASVTEYGTHYPGDGITIEGHSVHSGITEYGHKVLSLEMIALGAIALDLNSTNLGDRALLLTRDYILQADLMSTANRLGELIRSDSSTVDLAVEESGTPEIRQSYTIGPDTSANFSATTWRGQTFTTDSLYTVTKVKLQLFRSTGSSPGTITVSIRDTVAGKPSGGDLCSGTINGNTIVEEPGPGNWYEISFGAGCALSAATQYAIVVRAESALNWAKWAMDTNSAYSGGDFVSSSNSGSSWDIYSGWDQMFEVWGTSSGGNLLSNRRIDISRGLLGYLDLVATKARTILYSRLNYANLDLIVGEAGTPEIQQSYIVDDNTFDNFFSQYWRGQTFTTTGAYTVTSVKLKIYRSGSPGTITVSIRDTTAGKPSGIDLCSGTTNGNTLTGVDPGEWREITFGAGYALNATTKYAIVIHGGDTSNRIFWRVDTTSPAYTGGNYVSSTDSGVSWSTETYDAMFEVWGSTGTGLLSNRRLDIGRGILSNLNLVSASLRTVNITQSITTSMHLLATALYKRTESIRTGSSALDLVSTSVRRMTLGRSNLAYLHLAGLSGRGITLIRDYLEALMLVVTKSRVVSMVRSSLSYLHLSAIGARAAAYIHSGSQVVDFIVSITTGSLSASEVGLLISSSMDEIGEIISSYISEVGEKSTEETGELSGVASSRILYFDRQGHRHLGLVAIGNRVSSLFRSTLEHLALHAIGYTTSLYDYLGSIGVKLLATSLRGITLTRTRSSSLDLIPTATRLSNLVRSSTSVFTLVTVYDRLLEVARRGIQTLNLSLTANRVRTVIRTVTTNLSLTKTGQRLASMSRSTIKSLKLFAAGNKGTVATFIGECVLSLTTLSGRLINVTHSDIGQVDLVSTGHRTIVGIRDNLAMLSLITSGVRRSIYTRINTIILHLQGIGEWSREELVVKIGVAVLKLTRVSTRRIIVSKTITKPLRLVKTGHRTLVLGRSRTSILSMAKSGLKVLNRIKTGLTHIHLTGTATRRLIIGRIKTAPLDFVAIASYSIREVFDYIRSGLVSLDLVGTANRITFRNKAQLGQLEMVGTSSKRISVLHQGTTYLHLLASASRKTIRTFASLTHLKLLATGVRSRLFIRTDVEELKLKPSGSKYRGYDRLDSAVVEFISTGERTISIGRTARGILNFIGSSVVTLKARFTMVLVSRHNQPYIMKSKILPYVNITSRKNQVYTIRRIHND